jgi:hypothetical protein
MKYFFLSILFFTASLHAATYYVAKTGGNGNPGTIGSPWLTVQYGVNQLIAGDTLFVRTGTYHEWVVIAGDGTAPNPIVVINYTGESVVIDGEGHLPAGSWRSLVDLTGDYVYISGFEVKNSNMNGTFTGGAGITLKGIYDKVSNCIVHDCWENGILIQGDYGIVEDSQVWNGCMANAGNQSSPHSSGLTAARDLVDGITTGAIIRRNTVHDCWGEGISSYEADGTLIEDNITYDNLAYDLYISDSPNTTAQRNIIYSITGQLNAWGGLVIGDELSYMPRTINIKIINNCLLNSSLWAFSSTNVPGAGLNQAYIENNTLIESYMRIGESPTDGTVTVSAWVRNNIFHDTARNPWGEVGSVEHITFSNNFWNILPPSDMRGTGDLTGDAGVSKTGSITKNYFKLTVNSLSIGAGLVVAEVTSDISGNPRLATNSIGVWEYSTTGYKVMQNGQPVMQNGKIIKQ